MILYRCTECGEDIPGEADGTPARIRWQATTLVNKSSHFCSLQCATDWADSNGYADRAEQ